MSQSTGMFKFTNPQITTADGKQQAQVSLDHPGLLKKSFYAVEEPFVFGDALPRDLNAAKSKQGANFSPVKAALNMFNTYEEATAYAQHLNRPLMIVEIKPCATVKPQIASVTKINA